jgi:hypothetical protein
VRRENRGVRRIEGRDNHNLGNVDDVDDVDDDYVGFGSEGLGLMSTG